MGLELGLFARGQIRLVRQTEVAECGLACLTMIAAYHGLEVDLGTMRRRFASSLRGASLRTLIELGDKIGLACRAVKVSLEALPDIHTPAILHWDMHHYVVVERFSRGRALIHNPDGRSQWISLADISDHFTGVALELRPTSSFEQGTHRERLKLSQLWHRMNGMKRALAQILVLSLVLEAFVLVSPYYMQIAIDNALPALDHNLLAVLAVGFGLFTLFNGLASLLRSFVLLIAGTTLGFGIAINIGRRLFRLPVEWFEKRHTGDILSRFQSISPIQQMLTTGTIGALVDGVLALFTVFLMFSYSVKLTALAILCFFLYGLVRIVSFSLQRATQEAQIVSSAKEQTAMMESLRGITTLRLFGREMLRHAYWQTQLTEVVNNNIRLSRIGIWQNSANTVIFGVETVASTWLAIGFVIDGNGFSLGMVIAFMAYKGQFIQKATTLIDQAISFRMLGLHLERLSDIALTPEDKTFGPSSDLKTMLTGRIELRDVCYRYSPSDPLVLECINLLVEPGEHVAITGPSGGGKSTLVKLLLGLVEPDGGEILIDGLPLIRFGHKSYHGQVAAVLQDDSLFAGSLAENIALFDDNIDMIQVIAAATAASIHEDIMRMPMKYETRVGNMGTNISGGEKQRVLLARAFYRRPKLLIMDEGTAHLDMAHERMVNEAITAMGITRIIIAHRRETIEAAERILIMNRGRLQPVPQAQS